MKSNPFESPSPKIDSPQSETEPKGVSFPAIAIQLIRLSLACCIFFIVPLFVAPRCNDLFQEFGIELPVITRTYFSICSLLQTYFWIYFPLALAIVIGIEIAVHKIPLRTIPIVVSLLYWLLLLLLLVATVAALWTPYQSVVSGLAG